MSYLRTASPAGAAWAGRIATSLSLILCLALSACGGGGSSSPAAPTVQAVVNISAAPTSVVAGDTVTVTWSTQNSSATTCDASGAWSGQLATSGSKQVTTAASTSSYTANYTLTCGQTANTASVNVTPPPVNNVDVTLDSGPPAASGQVNVPFVSVTVCRPGTAICQTIDHVLLDTGSYGLRLIAPLDTGLALPTLTSSSGAAVGECAQFISGYTWGAVARADVKLGGEVASALPIQIIGQAPGGVATAPSTCSSVGNNIGTVAALGANGILGVGLFKQDCGSACVNSAVSATYYACATTGCTSTTMPLSLQVSNPVASFTRDNNGVVLKLPSVGPGGATALSGTLFFGIGTQANNGLGGATRYAANSKGNFSTVYKGTTMSASFIDSGSNGLYFNDSSIATCTTSADFYCPASPLALSALTMAFDGTASSTISFTLQNADKLAPATVASYIGGTNGSNHSTGDNAFDWGLPFFFGRPVFVGFETDPSGPYWAY
jgi:hypothetical protein